VLCCVVLVESRSSNNSYPLFGSETVCVCVCVCVSAVSSVCIVFTCALGVVGVR